MNLISLQLSIERGIEFLLSEQKENFQESIHKLTFPRPGIFGIPVFENHQVNLFQRAIAMEALLCAQYDGFAISSKVINEEVDHIIRSKHPLVRGGWSYIPDLNDFPPDLDNLGAILQIAAKVNNETLRLICDDAAELVFDACINQDGSIPTWIVNREDTSEAVYKIKRCIEVIGGMGTHVEVMANFLEGLLEYGSQRKYKNHIKETIKYIAGLQQSDGSWMSKWYWGNVYSTYRVLNVLSKANFKDYHTDKLYSFLISQQSECGSWGEKNGATLDTSFGVLCLCCIWDRGYICRITSGLQWLLSNQLEDGSWAASKFIKMETRGGIVSYGSKTISTSFALKAILMARKIL